MRHHDGQPREIGGDLVDRERMGVAQFETVAARHAPAHAGHADVDADRRAPVRERLPQRVVGMIADGVAAGDRMEMQAQELERLDRIFRLLDRVPAAMGIDRAPRLGDAAMPVAQGGDVVVVRGRGFGGMRDVEGDDHRLDAVALEIGDHLFFGFDRPVLSPIAAQRREIGGHGLMPTFGSGMAMHVDDPHRSILRAFSGEVGTGSPQKMRLLKDNQSEFQFHWNGIRSGGALRACTHKVTMGDRKLVNVRFGPACELNSDISRGPTSATIPAVSSCSNP